MIFPLCFCIPLFLLISLKKYHLQYQLVSLGMKRWIRFVGFPVAVEGFVLVASLVEMLFGYDWYLFFLQNPNIPVGVEFQVLHLIFEVIINLIICI